MISSMNWKLFDVFFCRLDATNVGIISDPDRKLSDSIGKGGCSFMYITIA